MKNKQKYNKDIMNIKYDTPIYFNIEEVFNYITNNVVINKAEGLNESPYIIDQNGQKKEIVSKDDYFKIYKFIPTSATKAEKQSKVRFMGIRAFYNSFRK